MRHSSESGAELSDLKSLNLFKILIDYLKIEIPEKIEFHEYISSDKMQPSGKKQLCFSAMGLVFMVKALEEIDLTVLGIRNYAIS